MIRIAIGELWHETNTFSPIPTTEDRFERTAGDELLRSFEGTASELGGILDAAENADDDVDIHPVASMRAVPSGPVDDTVFESFTRRFCDNLAGVELDGVVLSLHGSMVTDQRDDPEGEFLDRLRDVVGDVPIVTTLDHHANVTERMIDTADAFVAYREHPHTGEDIRQTGERAARLAFDAIRGCRDPRMAMVKVPMVTTTRIETTRQPMCDLFALRAELETKDDALVVSLCPVQSWLDVPGLGFAAIAVTDGTPDRATEYAETLAREAWERRDDFKETFPTIDEALDRTQASEARPVVLSDRGDVTLGGAPGDSPVVLRALLERESDLEAAIPIVDPDAVDELGAETGGRQEVDVGGKLTPSFSPVTVCGEVVRASKEPLRLEGDYYSGKDIDMGTRLLFRVSDTEIRLILSESPGVTTHPSFFAGNDVDPEAMDLLVVKSIGTFRPGFEPIAGEIIIADTPGVCSIDLTQFDFKKARPVYPLDDVEPAFEPHLGR